MRFREIFAHHPDVERRRSPLPNLGRIGQHLAVFLQLVDGGRPDVGTVDISALPGGDNRGRLQVHQLHLGRLDAPVLQRRQQAVVGGGNKGHGDALADQIFRAADAFLHYQRLGVAELGRQ